MRYRILFLALFGFANVHLASQESIKIWNEVTATKKMKHVEMITYIAENNPKGLAVIICPGGSYSYLAINDEGIKVAAWFQKNGITSFVLRYRTNNRHPAMIQDLQR